MTEGSPDPGQGSLARRWHEEEQERLEEFLETEVIRRMAVEAERIRTEERKRVMHRVFKFLLHPPDLIGKNNRVFTKWSPTWTEYRAGCRAAERVLRAEYTQGKLRPDEPVVLEFKKPVGGR